MSRWTLPLGIALALLLASCGAYGPPLRESERKPAPQTSEQDDDEASSPEQTQP